jgi:CheY-like chemotaxis protein
MSAKAALDNCAFVILIAEDDPNDVLLLKRAFAKARINASLFFVSNGLEVISYLQGEPPFSNRSLYPLPSLLLLDLNMPAVGGLGVLEWLVAHPVQKLRVVVFSSCIGPEQSREAVKLGARACMNKPLNPLELLPIMRELPGFTEVVRFVH